MSSLEIRAAFSLASIFALRMLGLFLILPVFAIHAKTLPGYDITLVGWVLGIYGLTQGLLQIPFGMASDRFGRKPVIVFGLVLFAIGSFKEDGPWKKFRQRPRNHCTTLQNTATRKE